MSNLYIPFCALVLNIFLIILFLAKVKRFKNSENLYYFYMIVDIFLSTFLCIIAIFLIYEELYNSKIVEFSNRLECYLIFSFASNLLMYIHSFCYPNDNSRKKLKLFNSIIKICAFIYMIIMPISLNINKESNYMVVEGAPVLMANVLSIIYLIIISYLTLKNKKKLGNKVISIICVIMFLSIVAIIRELMPEFICMEFLLTISLLIMYHTIENPDMKMIEKLNIARDQAEKANRAKSDFLSSMSHEIRTPLNAIVGFSEAVKTSNNLDEAVENADYIITASGTLLEIVNGILDISKIESGKLEIVNSNYNAKDLFENVSKLVEHRIAEKALDFQINIAEDIPDRLYGDYANIKKVVTNLLSNAAKYTEQGYVKYDVNCIKKDNICRLIISVEDSGRGIKPEQMNKLFTKFQRLDEDKNTTVEGTGLGLAITKHLIEMMGGEIVVQSKYGEGSKFTVTLDQRISLEENVENTISYSLNNIEIDIKDKKVLVVDDNTLNLKVAKKALEPYTSNVELVESGFICLERLEENDYDLILLDDMMPKMSGKETLVKIKQMGVKTPIVALTANAISGEREKYINLGFNEYLSKPIDKRELERVLKRVFYNVNSKKVDNKFESKFKDIPFEEVENMKDTIIVIKD